MNEITSYPEKVSILKDILKSAIQELCEHAKKNKFLEFPYGKNPDPTPLISEQQFVDMGGLACDDLEPSFKYEYGFDPLKFLSDYLVWAHPEAVRKREEEKLKAQDRLAFRANHAVHQLQTHEYLKKLKEKLESGIEWGPFTLPLNMTTVRCVIKPFKAGIIYCQLSTEKNFENILRMYKIFQYPPTNEENAIQNVVNMSQIFDIQNLQEKKCYYLRCFAIPWDETPMTPDPKFQVSMIEMTENDEKYQQDWNFAKERAQYAYGNTFWTIPDPTSSFFSSTTPVVADYSIHNQFPYDRQSVCKLQVFGQFPVTSLQRRWDRVFAAKKAATSPSDLSEFADLTEEEKDQLANDVGVPSTTGLLPQYSCFLGDLFEHSFYDRYEWLQQQFPPSTSIEELMLAYYQTQLTSILSNFSEYATTKEGFEQTIPLSREEGLLKALQSPHFFAWRDSNPQSSQLLKWEESIFKQYRHDLRKYQKKYGLEDEKKGGKKAKKASSTTTAAAHVPPAPVLKRPPLSPQLDALLQVRSISFPSLDTFPSFFLLDS